MLKFLVNDIIAMLSFRTNVRNLKSNVRFLPLVEMTKAVITMTENLNDVVGIIILSISIVDSYFFYNILSLQHIKSNPKRPQY